MKSNPLIDSIADKIKHGQTAILVQVPKDTTLEKYQRKIYYQSRRRHYDWHILNYNTPSNDVIIIKPYRIR